MNFFWLRTKHFRIFMIVRVWVRERTNDDLLEKCNLWLGLWNMPCPAAHILDGKRKTGLVTALVFSSSCWVFSCVCGTVPPIIAAMLTGIKSWSKEFLLNKKKLHRLKLHLSRRVAQKCFVGAIEKFRVSKSPRRSMPSVLSESTAKAVAKKN